MLEVIFINYKPLLKILLYTIIFIVITISIFWKKINAHVLENWNTYRKNPIIIPFAGLFKEEKGLSFVQIMTRNFIAIIKQLTSKILKILMIPVYAVSKIFIGIIKLITRILQKFRKQLNVLRNFMMKMFEDMYIRLQNAVGAVVFYLLKMRESLKRTFGLFSLVLNTIEHSQIFFESLMSGPVGKFARISDWMGIVTSTFTLGFPLGRIAWRDALHVDTKELMCFSPDTKLILRNNESIFLKNIKIGDILQDNSKVIAKMQNSYFGNIYSIDDIEVTANHIIKYNEQWIRVENHPEAILKPYNNISVMCLVTDTGIIQIGSHIFKDYLDSHNKDTNEIINKLINTHFNAKGTNNCHNLLSGFIYDSNIDERYITGVVEILPNTLDLYDINGNILSGNILIKYNNNWLRASSYPTAKYIGKNIKKCYHFISENDIIKFKNGDIIRDFIEIKDSTLNNKIDKIVEIEINS